MNLLGAIRFRGLSTDFQLVNFNQVEVLPVF
jgi:hypothetical protein